MGTKLAMSSTGLLDSTRDSSVPSMGIQGYHIAKHAFYDVPEKNV